MLHFKLQEALMQFVYHALAGEETLGVEGELFRHLFRARRTSVQNFDCRNLQDDYLYTYAIQTLDKKKALLSLQSKTIAPKKPTKMLHLGWCIIDPNDIEKTLPALNELGVGKISFLRCDRSQGRFKISFERLRKILIASCQQCGRSNLMEVEELGCVQDFFDRYGDGVLMDFGGTGFKTSHERYIVGPEGGFSEKELMAFDVKMRFETPFILKSQTAIEALASRWFL